MFTACLLHSLVAKDADCHSSGAMDGSKAELSLSFMGSAVPKGWQSRRQLVVQSAECLNEGAISRRTYWSCLLMSEKCLKVLERS